MDLKTINRRIKHIATSAARINEYIQETAVGIIIHAKEHGDCSAALRLVQAMPKSFRRGLLIDWFARYSPIGMNVTGGKCGLHKPTSKAYNPFNVDGARMNMWFNQEQANEEDLPDTTLADVKKGFESLAKRFQKKLDEGTIADNDRDEVIRYIAAAKELAA